MALTFICDGEFEIVRITEDLYDDVKELYCKYFLQYENICRAVNLLTSPKAVEESTRLLRFVLNDGISFALRQCATKKIVAICCNKILNPTKQLSFESIFASFSSREMLNIASYLQRMENSYNIFKEWQLDCVLEIEFITVDFNFAKRGFARKLTEYTLAFAQRMCRKQLTMAEWEALPAHIRDEQPKAAVSVFTTLYTQKIGQKLGFQILNRISFKEFTYDEQTYAERIEAVHEYSIFAGFKL